MICLRISSKSSSLTILKRRRIERATVGKGQLQLKDVLDKLSCPINDNYDDDKYVDDDYDLTCPSRAFQGTVCAPLYKIFAQFFLKRK